MAIIAFYLRLSVADGDLGKEQKNESNSIENQRQLLCNYLENNTDLAGEVKEYIDDGYTGTNFDRPAFQEMFQDVKKGIVGSILVKDLSRFGRDYIGVGDYIEQIFPLLGVRFIAVNNNFDSNKHLEKSVGLDMAVSNIINQMYSRDTSKKVRSAFRAKWKQGIATSRMVPFGYRKDPKNKGKWVIDPEAARYIRLIFDKAIEGWTTSRISKYLNDASIPTAGEYNEQHHLWDRREMVVKDHEKLWNTTMIWRVLNKYEYTGALVMGKRSTLIIGSKIKSNHSIDECFITEEAQEPIVTREEFELAQATIRMKKSHVSKTINEYSLRGKIRCGNCNLALVLQTKRRNQAFFCSHGRSVGIQSKCCKEAYDLKMVEARVWYAIVTTLRVFKTYEDRMNKQTDYVIQNNRKSVIIKEYEREIDSLKAERIHQYESYADGLIDKNQYMKAKQRISQKMESLETSKKALVEEVAVRDGLYNEVRKYAKLSDQIEHTYELTQDMVDTFIDKVYIYDTKRIEVVFLFEDIIERVAEKIAI